MRVLVWLALLLAWAWAEPGPRSLVDFRQELKLSGQQVEAITSTLQRFQEENATLRFKLNVAERETASLVERRGDLAAIKANLKQASDLQYQMRLLDLETSRKLEGILSPEQLKRWQAIQAKERRKKP
ncbi:MAG: hypothetical protein AMXMBFR33_52790 [Candidatus Xenobia bacterium]